MPNSYSEISSEQSEQFLVCTYAVCNVLCSDVQTVEIDGAGGIHNRTCPRLQVMAHYERGILFVTRGTLPWCSELLFSYAHGRDEGYTLYYCVNEKTGN